MALSMSKSGCIVRGDEDPSRDLAQWLQEVARRRAPACALREPPATVCEAREEIAAPRRSGWQAVRESLPFAGLVAAYLQYHLIGDMLQIMSLNSIIVFV